MKKIVLSVFVLGLSMSLFAQATKKPPVKKTSTSTSTKTVSTVPMKNALDSFSYAIGLSIANFYKEQGVKNINNNLVIKALNDSKAGKPMLNEAETNNCIVGYMQVVGSEKASGNKKIGEEFLADNKRKDGVIALPSGLQYQVMQQGSGPKPTLTDKVKVHYHGTLIDGTIFDSSVQRGEPYTLNSLTEVITGWTEVLQLMPVGSKWKIFIPSSLAYGDNQAGPAIKPGSMLIFELELLDIVK